MLTAILADIHANLEAFQAVIADLEGRPIDSVLGLGDLIGYGPDPDEVVSLFRRKGYISVQGNHEAALSDRKMRSWLNFQARENSIITEQLLSPENRAYCRALPENMTTAGALFVHGFPPSSLLRYLTMASDNDLQSYLHEADTPLCFVGHAHVLAAVTWDGQTLTHDILTAGHYQLSDTTQYLINAGSVGQPRDGTSSAKYLLWDSLKNRLEIVCVDYDIGTTVAKIEKRGFPEAYGLRLW